MDRADGTVNGAQAVAVPTGQAHHHRFVVFERGIRDGIHQQAGAGGKGGDREGGQAGGGGDHLVIAVGTGRAPQAVAHRERIGGRHVAADAEAELTGGILGDRRRRQSEAHRRQVIVEDRADHRA